MTTKPTASTWPEEIYLVPQLLEGDYFLKELPAYTDEDIFVDYHESSQKLSYPDAVQVKYIRSDIAAAREQGIRQDADHRIVNALRFLDCQKTWNGQGYTWNPVNPEMLIRMLSSVIGSDDCDKLQKEQELAIIRATLEAIRKLLPGTQVYFDLIEPQDILEDIDPATILNNMEKK